MSPELCTVCKVPLATGACRHVLIDGEQATLTVKEWHRLTDELTRLRTLEAALADGERPYV